MKNNWSKNFANKYIKKYKKLGFSKDLALRVYTTRLLGRNKELVYMAEEILLLKPKSKILMVKNIMFYALKEVDGIWQI